METNELCKHCGWRCVLLFHNSKRVAKDFVCYIQQDAGYPELPIQHTKEGEKCEYFEKEGL